MADNSDRSFSAEQLALVSDPDDGGVPAAIAAKDTPAPADAPVVKDAPAAKGVPAAKDAPVDGVAAVAVVKDGDKKTIATGGDVEADDKAKDDAKAAAKQEQVDRNELTEDLRKMIAEHYAAGDKKAEAKELRRLERVKDIKSLWGLYRELEGKFTSGGLVKVPGKDAKPEEVAAYHKALGVPEKPEDYLPLVKLENGAVIGAADKPLVDGFAAAVHKTGATPAVVNAALNWYYGHQEAQAAEMDEADDSFRRESERTLKDEFGPTFKRQTNAIATLFAAAPGGTDIANPNSFYARLMGGRMADGKIIGNDPDAVRFLVGLASEINPAATVVEGGNQSGLSIDAEIKSIEGRMKTDRQAYFKDEPAQARYRELITARDKIRARS